jgi:outer membrane lipoprotein-sorting protein
MAGRLLLFLCLVSAACRSPAPPPSPLSPETLIRRVQYESARLKDLKGSAVVTAAIAGQKGKASARIQYRHPDQFRIDIQGPFLQILAVLSIQGQQVRLYYPQENIVFEGTLDDQETVVPGLRLPLADIRTAAVGLVELARYPADRIVDYQYDPASTVIAVQDSATGATRKIWIDPRHASVLREEESTASGVAVVRTFDRYTPYGGIWRPARIRITNGSAEETFELSYNTQSVNTGLTAADLSVRFPRSVVSMPLREAARWFE